MRALFFMSAGARFTVILLTGKRRTLFFTAERTRSLLSFTAASAGHEVVSHHALVYVRLHLYGNALQPVEGKTDHLRKHKLPLLQVSLNIITAERRNYNAADKNFPVKLKRT